MIAFLLAAALATPQAELANALKDRVAGEPTRCLNLTQTVSSQIVPGVGVIFDAGGTRYLNRPRSGADRLRRDDILSYRVYGGQLCRGEPVYRLDRSTGAQYGFILLGDFVPYRRPRDR